MRLLVGRTLVVLILAVTSAANSAEQTAPTSAKAAVAPAEQKADAPLVAQMKKKLQSMNLPPEVLAQATKIVDEFGPQYVAAQKKRQAVLTDKQRAAQAATAKANQQAGKKGRDVLEGIQEAIQLTPEQKTQWDAAEKEKNAVGAKLYDALRTILTSEQQQQFGVPEKGSPAYAD